MEQEIFPAITKITDAESNLIKGWLSEERGSRWNEIEGYLANIATNNLRDKNGTNQPYTYLKSITFESTQGEVNRSGSKYPFRPIPPRKPSYTYTSPRNTPTISHVFVQRKRGAPFLEFLNGRKSGLRYLCVSLCDTHRCARTQRNAMVQQEHLQREVMQISRRRRAFWSGARVDSIVHRATAGFGTRGQG